MSRLINLKLKVLKNILMVFRSNFDGLINKGVLSDFSRRGWFFGSYNCEEAC